MTEEKLEEMLERQMKVNEMTATILEEMKKQIVELRKEKCDKVTTADLDFHDKNGNKRRENEPTL